MPNCKSVTFALFQLHLSPSRLFFFFFFFLRQFFPAGCCSNLFDSILPSRFYGPYALTTRCLPFFKPSALLCTVSAIRLDGTSPRDND